MACNGIRALLVLSTLVCTASLSAWNWLAIGELRGDVEPCGCAEDTDFGGILRLGSYIAKERKLYPDLFLFDLGNKHALKAGQGVKNTWIGKAVDALKPVASLVNHSELSSKRFPAQALLSNLQKHNQTAKIAKSSGT